MDDRVSPEFVPAAVGHVGLSGLRLLLCDGNGQYRERRLEEAGE